MKKLNEMTLLVIAIFVAMFVVLLVVGAVVFEELHTATNNVNSAEIELWRAPRV